MAREPAPRLLCPLPERSTSNLSPAMNSGDAEKVNTPALAERLRARIAREGAITFHDWMETALYDREAGYYQRDDLVRWGRAGDYRTSAERSVLFAATFAS